MKRKRSGRSFSRNHYPVFRRDKKIVAPGQEKWVTDALENIEPGSELTPFRNNNLLFSWVWKGILFLLILALILVARKTFF